MTISKHLKKLNLSEKLLLLVSLTLPFERIPTLEVPFGADPLTVKLSLIAGLGLILSLLLNLAKNTPITRLKNNLTNTLKLPKQTLRSNWLIFLPTALTAYSLISYFSVGNTSYWLHANLVQGFVITLFYAAYLTVRSSNDQKQLIHLLLQTILVSSGVAIAFGLFQWAGDLGGISSGLTQIRPEYAADRLGLPRMHSTFLEPLYFGLFLLLPLSILFADRKESVLPKLKRAAIKPIYIRFIFIGVIYLCILLSLARGAIAASALIGLIGMIYNFKTIRQSLNIGDYIKLSSFAVLTILSLVIITGQFGQKGKDEDHDYNQGFSTILEHLKTTKIFGSDKDIQETNSIGERQIARETAVNVARKSKKNLILGVGPGQYGEQFTPVKGFGETSNFLLLDVLIEYGLVGLSIIGLFFIALIVYLRRMLKTNSVVLSAALLMFTLGFLLQSISFGEIAITHYWVFLGIVLGVIYPSSQKNKLFY